LKSYFKEKDIYFHTKHPPLKANFAEYAIYRIKKPLYTRMRLEQTRLWTHFLQEIVENINSQPSPSLGYSKRLKKMLCPDMFSSSADDYKMEKNIYMESWRKRRRREKNYFKKQSNLQINDYVYLNFQKNTFDKSYFAQVKMPIINLLAFIMILYFYNLTSH
jgi:hypothetical protein